MAGLGKLGPQDWVRLATEADWFTADRLKGLTFASPERKCAVPTSVVNQAEVSSASSTKDQSGSRRGKRIIQFGARCFRETGSFLLGLATALMVVPNMALAMARVIPVRARYGRLLFEHRTGPNVALQQLDGYEAEIQSINVKQNPVMGRVLRLWFSFCQWLGFVRLSGAQSTVRFNGDVERLYFEGRDRALAARNRVRDAFRTALPVDRAATMRIALTLTLAALPAFLLWPSSPRDTASSSQQIVMADSMSLSESPGRSSSDEGQRAVTVPSIPPVPRPAVPPRPRTASSRQEGAAVDLDPRSEYRTLELIRFEMADMPIVMSFQVAGPSSENEYEIVVANQRALLRTVFTRFESQGWARMAVVRDGSEQVVTKSGFNATWPVFREALSDAGAFALSVDDVATRTAAVNQRRHVAMWAIIVGLMEEGFTGGELEVLATHLGTVRNKDSERELLEIQTRFASARQNDLDGLISAIRSGDIEIVRAVLDRRKGRPAVPLRGPNIIVLALDHFRDPTELDKLLDLLREHGMGIDAADDEGRTAVHAVAVGNDTRKLESLVRLGAKVNVADARGATPLHLVAGEWRVEFAKMLLSHGAAVDAVDADGRSPIFYAAMKGQRDMIDLLLQHNPNLNLQDGAGCTVLHHAAKGCQLETVQKLIVKGADKLLKDKNGLPPAGYARDHSGIREELATRAVVSLGDENAWGLTAADGTLRTGWVEDRIDGFITKRRLDGSEEWRTSFEGADARYPCVAADGTVILWINSSYRKGMFIAVDPKGQIAWKLPIEEHASPPAVGADGTLYFTVRGRLRALDRQGRSKWELPIDDDDTVSQLPPTVDPEGTIYVESRDSNRRWGLLAVAASGQKKWHFVATDSDSLQLLARPNFAPDGTILVGYRELNVHDGKLYALSSAGAKKWEVLVGDMQQRRATIDADGVTYVCGSALYAIAPDGKKLWKADISGEFSPVLGRDGNIYVVDVFGTLTRVKRDGTVAGSARLSSSRTAAAYEHGAGQTMHIYFHSGELCVIDYSLF